MAPFYLELSTRDGPDALHPNFMGEKNRRLNQTAIF
jgi:hypothetical protein